MFIKKEAIEMQGFAKKDYKKNQNMYFGERNSYTINYLESPSSNINNAMISISTTINILENPEKIVEFFKELGSKLELTIIPIMTKHNNSMIIGFSMNFYANKTYLNKKNIKLTNKDFLTNEFFDEIITIFIDVMTSLEFKSNNSCIQCGAECNLNENAVLNESFVVRIHDICIENMKVDLEKSAQVVNTNKSYLKGAIGALIATILFAAINSYVMNATTTVYSIIYIIFGYFVYLFYKKLGGKLTKNAIFVCAPFIVFGVVLSEFFSWMLEVLNTLQTYSIDASEIIGRPLDWMSETYNLIVNYSENLDIFMHNTFMGGVFAIFGLVIVFSKLTQTLKETFSTIEK